MRSYQSVLCTVSMLCLVLGCAKTEEVKIPDACEVLKTKQKELQVLTQNKSCVTVANCKFAGYGKRICGGVQDYLIYSTNNTDENTLLAKIGEYNVQQEECAKTANGTAGPCVVAIEPVLACLIGICVDTNP